VRSALEEIREGAPFLGRFVYDPFVEPAELLDGELLESAVGGTLEVVVDAGWLRGVSWRIGRPEPRVSSPSPEATTTTKDGSSTKKESDISKKAGAAGEIACVADAKTAPSWRLWDLAPFTKRRLWGTEVYTDDSDVLAMLVHSGWVKVDVPYTTATATTNSRAGDKDKLNGTAATDQRDEETSHSQKTTEEHVEATTTSTPTATGKSTSRSLRVTLRVAPRLVRYFGTLRAGVKSRGWGNTHDGVSLLIEDVKVSETVS
jgi:hypothetical protein